MNSGRKPSALLVDFYELTMAECYFRHRRRMSASFDLFVRQMPASRSFLVSAGLEDIIAYLEHFSFDSREISYLESTGVFSGEFLAYLKTMRFTGDLWAMPEGTLFFPGEPLVRITAPLIEAQLVESFLLNTVNIQTMLASKAARCLLAAQGRDLFDFSLRRTHGSDASIKAARSSYLAGFSGTSNVLAASFYGIPLAGTMAHSFVLSFASEIEAFFAYSSTFPDKTILLVDTFDSRKGIQNAVQIGLELKKRGHQLIGIRLDSGNILELSRFARQQLDAAGLQQVKIVASGNLDEYQISTLLKKKAPVDSFGVGTHMGTSSDAPVLDAIYKLCEVGSNGRELLPVMKLSTNKMTYPGRKQVYRLFDRKKTMRRDIICLEHEKCPGTPLLVKVMEKGRRIIPQPGLVAARALFKDQCSRLPAALKKLQPPVQPYPVQYSEGLLALVQTMSKQLE